MASFDLDKEYLSLDDVLLVPAYSEIASRLDTDISTTLVGNIKIKIPVVSAAMDTISGKDMGIKLGRLGGAAFLHRFASDEEIVSMVKDIKEAGQLAIPSIGIRKDIVQWVDVLLGAGADVISIDIAHGHSKEVLTTIGLLKGVYKEACKVVAGNVATKEGVHDLIEAGADAVKVFVGPGAACSTRVVTGFGVPTFSCLVECLGEASRHNIPIIADGGLKAPGDFTKCLAVGASACMSGSMLSATDETPGKYVKIRDKFYKEYRGMASEASQKDFKRGLKLGTASEGEAMLFESKGPVKDVIDRITGGIRSGLTYCGAKNLQELREKARFIRITQSAAAEGLPHGLNNKGAL